MQMLQSSWQKISSFDILNIYETFQIYAVSYATDVCRVTVMCLVKLMEEANRCPKNNFARLNICH